MTPRGRRTRVLGAVMALLGLPVLVALLEAVSFNVANRSNGAMVSSGEKREYLLHVPKSYDHARKTPLVISMHGGGMWGAAQREVSQWNRVADEHGFIVVYPSGIGPLARHRAWRATGGAGSRKDVRFISDLIDTLTTAGFEPLPKLQGAAEFAALVVEGFVLLIGGLSPFLRSVAHVLARQRGGDQQVSQVHISPRSEPQL